MTATDLAFRVYGTPAPQGSKRAFVRGNRAIIVEQQHERVASWRDDVKGAALAAIDNCGQRWTPMPGPIHIQVTFWLKRPAGHYGTGRNAQTLKPSAPAWPARMPDLDKLQRSTFDALTQCGVWGDDGQIVFADISKQYARDYHPPGADIRVADIDHLKAVVAERISALADQEATA
jgi:Holliday junction resolvase RusA-like endonuclease